MLVTEYLQSGVTQSKFCDVILEFFVQRYIIIAYHTPQLIALGLHALLNAAETYGVPTWYNYDFKSEKG